MTTLVDILLGCAIGFFICASYMVFYRIVTEDLLGWGRKKMNKENSLELNKHKVRFCISHYLFWVHTVDGWFLNSPEPISEEFKRLNII